MYIALYTHRNTVVYENKTEGLERILAYSATDVMEHAVIRSNSTLFNEVIKYNGQVVSVYMFSNGYKGIIVQEEEEIASLNSTNNTDTILKEMSLLKTKILHPSFDECKVLEKYLSDKEY